MMQNRFIVIAGEEAGPGSNKLGGIWNVIDAEAKNLAEMIGEGVLGKGKSSRVIVAGPYYGHSGADWHKGLNRITDMSGFSKYEPEGELGTVLKQLAARGIETNVGVRKLGKVDVIYVMFATKNFTKMGSTYNGQSMTLSSMIKAEAYDLLGLDSLHYESMNNGNEYTHYLNLSYAISELVRLLAEAGKATQLADKAMDEGSIIPSVEVSLHCHEFGVFYAAARLEKMGVSVHTVATYHATIPGRVAGHRSIQKVRDNDSSFDSGVPINFIKLESLSSYADVVTAVGDSTRKEIKLFYGTEAIVIRNGIDVNSDHIEWERKARCRRKLQDFLSETIYKVFDSKLIAPEKIVPIFSISRIEVENKGYPDLLDSLVILDRMIRTEIDAGHLDEDFRVICFIVAAHGPKTNTPENFPINLPEDILIGDEMRLQQMIKARGLECSRIPDGSRHVAAVLYPQWISAKDGGLNMSTDDFMAGCIAGVFPSRYEPFLLTGLEAGKEATPSIVSRICGFSDALGTLKRLVMGMGGVIVVDNINLSYIETMADYALAMDYFISTYLNDKVKYNLLCQEASLLAKDMNWKNPTREYYELLTGMRIE